MRFPLIFILSLLSYSSILGQNTRSELKDLNFENYSRQQIRTYLLMIEPEDSEIYELARRSRTNQKWSYVFYGLSAAYFVGSIYGFSTMDQVNDGILGPDFRRNTAQIMLGFSALHGALGIWQTHRSRARLDKALKLYRDRD